MRMEDGDVMRKALECEVEGQEKDGKRGTQEAG